MSSSAASAPKRGRPDDEPEMEQAGPQDVVTRQEFESVFDTFRKDFFGDMVKDVTTELDKKCTGKLESLFRDYDKAVTKKFEAHEHDIADLRARADATEEAQKKMKDDIERIRAALAVAESAAADVTAAIQNDEFDRDPDPTIIRLNAAESVAHESVKTAVSEWIALADIVDDQWELQGDPRGISRNFVIKLRGAPGLAARRVKKCLGLRRNADGSWRPNMKVTSPLGREIEVYVSPDKSPKQLRTEQGGRRLLKAFRAVHPNKATHLDKRSGMVSVEWKPCARVTPNAEPNSYVVMWNHSVVTQTQVQKAQIMDVFNSETGNVAGVQWEI